MINVKDKLVNELEKVVNNVSDTYPQSFQTMPAVSYCEENNSVYEETDEGEASSLIRFRIGIWDTVSTSQTAVKIDEVISKFGFKRIACSDVGEPTGIKHKLMRYEAVIDIDQSAIYHKN